MNWNESVALITGASSGIGRAVAKELSSEGAQLTLIDINEDGLSETKNLPEIDSNNTMTLEADVTNEKAMADAIDQTVDRFGTIDLSFANAGLGYPTAGDELELDSVKRLLEVNVDGVLNTLAPCIEVMKDNNSGHLAITSSAAAFRGIPGGAAYCASKAAVLRLGESLRYDLEDHGINVTTIHPGWIKTPMTSPFEETLKFGEITAQEAAEHIRYAVENRKTRYVFPWQMALTIRLMKFLPESLIDYVLSLAPSPENTLQSKPRTEDEILS